MANIIAKAITIGTIPTSRDLAKNLGELLLRVAASFLIERKTPKAMNTISACIVPKPIIVVMLVTVLVVTVLITSFLLLMIIIEASNFVNRLKPLSLYSLRIRPSRA